MSEPVVWQVAEEAAGRGCAHLGEAAPGVVPGSPEGCEDCLRIGSDWVHLRLCLVCGHVGCCDSSPHRHAAAHAREAGHHLARSFEPGEEWAWCYVDQLLLLPVADG